MNDDDLDQLLDSVDIDELAAAEIDMDNLLDDVADALLGDAGSLTATSGRRDADACGDHDDVDLDLGTQQRAEECREWRAVTARVPPDLMAKWNRIFEGDVVPTESLSLFRTSDCYRGSSELPVQAKKLFQDCVRKALKNSKISEAQISSIMAHLLSDPLQHDAMMALFRKELLSVHAGRIEADPNYSPGGTFPNLDKYFASR